MQKFLKIVISLTFVLVAVFLDLYLKSAGGNSPKPGAPINPIIMMAVLGAVFGVWKYKPKKDTLPVLRKDEEKKE
jgi:hypothetical protein